MQHLSENLNIERFTKKKSAPNSERAFWIQEMANLTEMPFKVMFGKTMHLPTQWIHDFYDDAEHKSDIISKRKRLWQLIRDSKK